MSYKLEGQIQIMLAETKGPLYIGSYDNIVATRRLQKWISISDNIN
jgi:hypothetical protein